MPDFLIFTFTSVTSTPGAAWAASRLASSAAIDRRKYLGVNLTKDFSRLTNSGNTNALL